MINTMKNRLPAQIMIIVLVLMSILSIIALSVTMTSVRDKEEKAQNNQYQAYYAVGENKLLDFQQYIGKKTLSSLETNLTLTGDTGNATGSCGGIGNDGPDSTRTCTFDNISLANSVSQTAEVVKTIITVTDSSEITNFSAQKDKDILLDIQTATVPLTIYLSWAGSSTAWNFTVDKTDYTSEKTIFSPAGIFSQPFTSYTGSCFRYTSSGSSVTISITCGEKMFFRLRPLMNNMTSATTINSLSIEGNNIPLQRTLTNTTTTVNSGNADNPTVVLETTYLLIGQPLSLFDYVLRTESDVIKN